MKSTAAILLAVLLTSGPVIAGDLYRSNAVGIKGPPLEPGGEPPEYVLDISFENNTEIRQLFSSGEAVQRVEVRRDGTTVSERVFEDGSLRREIITRSDGTVVRESYYSEGVLTETSEYDYGGDLILRRTVTGEGGDTLYVERYSYWRDGTLRSIVKDDSEETRTEYRYRDGRLEEEWVSRTGESERFEFDPAGRLVIRERFVGRDLWEQEVRIYWGPDSGSLLKQVVVSADDRIIRRSYDERGRLVREVTEVSRDITRELVRTFRDDLLVSEAESDREGTREWQYQYTSDGERNRERYFEDDELIEVAHLILEDADAPADRMTELYNRGEPVLRIYYDGQTRLREDVVRDGEVIRSRTFDPPRDAPEDGG